jgi:hypothetical protein
MICHFCHQNLKPLPFDNWIVGGRREITYQCSKTTCGSREIRWSAGEGELGFWISMIAPDEEITNYSIPFEHKNRNYILLGFYPSKSYEGAVTLVESVSQSTNTMATYTPSPVSNVYVPFFKRKNIIELVRYYPILPYYNFYKQAVSIYEKLQPLILFS